MNTKAKKIVLIAGVSVAVLTAALMSGCYVQKYIEPGTESQYFQRGKSSQRLSDEKLNTFASSVKKVDGQAQSHYKMALHFQKNRRHKLAIEEFNKAVQRDPSMAKAYNAMGVSYDKLRQYGRAIHCYRLALQLDPDLDYVYNNLGYSYLLSNHPEAAIAPFQKALELNDHHKRYRYNLALAYVTTDRYDLAIEQLKGLEGGPHSGETVAKLARRLGKKNYETQIAAALQKNIAEDINVADAKPAETKSLSTGQAAAEPNVQTTVKNPDVIRRKIEYPAPEVAGPGGDYPVPELKSDQAVSAPDDRAMVEAKDSRGQIRTDSVHSPAAESENGSPHQHTRVAWEETADTPGELHKRAPAAPAMAADNRTTAAAALEQTDAASGTGRQGNSRATAGYGQPILLSAVEIVSEPPSEKSVSLSRESQNSDATKSTQTVSAETARRSQPEIEPRVVETGEVFKHSARENKSTVGVKLAAAPAREIKREKLDRNRVKVEIEVANGNGVNGMAGKVATLLKEKGFNVIKITNANSFDHATTKIFYYNGHRRDVDRLLKEIACRPDKRSIIELRRLGDRIKIIIGKDLVKQDHKRTTPTG